MDIRPINDALASFREDASLLGDYALLSKEELGNGYCDADDAGDEGLRSAYFSALMIRYWYKIFEWVRTSASLHLDYEDFMEWEVDALTYTLEKRVWRQPGHVLYQDPNGVDKAINQALGTMRGIAYQYWNKDKRRVNVNAASLDIMIDEDGDYAIGKAGVYEDPKDDSGIRDIVLHFVKEDKMIEALIVDAIAYYDTFKETKVKETITDKNLETGEYESYEVSHTSSKFNPRMLVKHLNNINEDFMCNYFSRTYGISLLDAQKTLEKLNKTSNPKLYKYIDKTLLEIKQDEYLMSCIS